jgi:hypothetical protein
LVTSPLYSGHGNVNDAASYVPGPPTAGVSDVLHWAGLFHYRPEQQLWCATTGRGRSASVRCMPLAEFLRDSKQQETERQRARDSGADS